MLILLGTMITVLIPLTQELNRGLLHCRRILSQLSCQGSPCIVCLIYFVKQSYNRSSAALKHEENSTKT